MKINNIITQLPRHLRKIYKYDPNRKIKNIVIHHSAGKGESIRQIANYHVYNRSYPAIGYHYVIMINGDIYQTNLDGTISYHVKDHNTNSLGICVLGSYEIEELNISQKAALHFLVSQFRVIYPDAEVKGHCEIGKTLCPGKNIKSFLNHFNY